MSALRSRLIPQPLRDGSLRVRVLSGRHGLTIELADLIRTDRGEGTLEVVEGGRAHIAIDDIAELASAMMAVRAEALNAEASALSAPRLKPMPPVAAPSRGTQRREEF